MRRPVGTVIVGGGLAAQRCAQTLRAEGDEAPIRIVGEEPFAPYDRPPLSKALLGPEANGDVPLLRPEAWYGTREVELLLGERAVGLDPGARRVRLASGATLPYERLLIATGAAPRRLPGTDGCENVHVLRSLADARRLREALTPGARLVVVGGGFIGLEAAASARGRGVEVTVVEVASTPLAAVLGERLGGWLAGMHRDEGVTVLTGHGVASVRRAGARATAVELDDGRLLACDAVLVAVGVAPAHGWLAGSGLEPVGGVPVDAEGRTALPGVFAAGDVATPWDPVLARHARSEHWESAVHQASAAARAMLGRPQRVASAPMFWSDQHGLRIQLVGRPEVGCELAIDGLPAERDFTATWTRDGRPLAVLLAGRPHELPRARQALAALHASPDSENDQT